MRNAIELAEVGLANPLMNSAYIGRKTIEDMKLLIDKGPDVFATILGND